MKRLGIVARCDGRGLSAQTHEAWRHLAPEATLVIDASVHSPYPQQFGLYPGAAVVGWSGGRLLDIETVRRFLTEVDVVWTAETFYDDAFVPLARVMGVRTVVHANPEFFSWATDESRPWPDVVALPTTWREAEMRAACAGRAEVVALPMPVARDRFPRRPMPRRVAALLHVAGHPAIHDRNGTLDVVAAMAHVRSPLRLLVHTQRPLPVVNPYAPRARDVRVEVVTDHAASNAGLYDEGDLFVFPRKFGGLALGLREAMSRGLGVLTTDLEPQNEWVPAEGRLATHNAGTFRTQSGWIPLQRVEPRELARAIDEIVEDEDRYARLVEASEAWAAAHSWDALLPLWQHVLRGVPRTDTARLFRASGVK